MRLHASLESRVASYQREHLVNGHCAEKALRHADHRTHAWVKSLYRVDIDDARHYSLVADVSRFSQDRFVEMLLAAGGVQPELVIA